MTEKETEMTSMKEDTSLAFVGETSSSRLEGEEVEFALCSSSEDALEGSKRVPERLYTTFPEYTHRYTCSHGSMIKLLVDIFLPFVIAGLANQDDSESDDVSH